MTAEVGIINQRGIALAADSAITMGGTKVINSATKIFTLDSAHYIGIMIFGNAEIMGIPWEVIIKSYRESLGNKTKRTVQNYVSSFLNYVASFRPLHYKKMQFQCVRNYTFEVFKLVNYQLKQNDNIGDAIKTSVKKYLPSKGNIQVSERHFKSEFAAYIADLYKQYYENMKVKDYEDYVDLFIDTVYKFTTFDYFSEYYTGVVIAGYGEREVFPSIYRMNIDGMIDRKLKYSDPVSWNASPMIENVNYSTPNIIPFAQTDVIFTLLTGISPELRETHELQVEKLGQELLKYNDNKNSIDDLVKEYKMQFDAHVNKEYISPIINLLEGLSINEMGEMAENLISLTSFKRKFSNDIGTVGGPTDVLTITKGEGPIWMKRKKYFDGQMNRGYELRRQ